MKKRIIACLLSLSMLISMTSCGLGGEKSRSESFFGYFDTFTTVYDYSGLEKSEFEGLVSLVKERLDFYNKLFDIYNTYDGVVNLADLNASAGGGALTLDDAVIDMLIYSKEMYELTDGRVNIAAGSVLKIWHDYREEGKELPPMALLEEAALHTDISKLVIDEELGTAELADEKMLLDVGAVAKGYAVEMIGRELRDAGYTSVVLDVGGNLKIIGEKPDGSGWKTGIRNPGVDFVGDYIYYLNIKNTSCVTSGGYERHYTVDGKKYHHLIDMSTLMPAEYLMSVSVITENSALADALSSALFLMPIEEGWNKLLTLEGVRVIWVMNGGRVVDSDDYAK